jgi:isochorismate synthase EntC
LLNFKICSTLKKIKKKNRKNKIEKIEEKLKENRKPRKTIKNDKTWKNPRPVGSLPVDGPRPKLSLLAKTMQTMVCTHHPRVINRGGVVACCSVATCLYGPDLGLAERFLD